LGAEDRCNIRRQESLETPEAAAASGIINISLLSQILSRKLNFAGLKNKKTTFVIPCEGVGKSTFLFYYSTFSSVTLTFVV